MVVLQHSYTEMSVALTSYRFDLDSASLAGVIHTDHRKHGKHRAKYSQCVHLYQYNTILLKV